MIKGPFSPCRHDRTVYIPASFRAQLAGMQIVKQWLLSEENLQLKNT